MNAEIQLLEIVREVRDAMGLPKDFPEEKIPDAVRALLIKSRGRLEALKNIRVHQETVIPHGHNLSATWAMANRALKDFG